MARDMNTEITQPAVTALTAGHEAGFSSQQLLRLQDWATYVLPGKYAISSIKAFRTDFNHFVRWCAENGKLPGFIDEKTAFTYFADQQHMAKTTLRRRQNSLATLYRTINEDETPNPFRSDFADAAIKAIAKAQIEEGEAPKPIRGQAFGLRWKHIQRIRAALSDSARDRQLELMLVLAYDGLLRVSELKALTIADFKTDEGALGETDATIHIRRSKTDQEGEGAHVFCRRNHARLAADWARALNLKPNDRLFRRLDRDGLPDPHQGQAELSTKAILFEFKRAGRLAGLKDQQRVSTHSCRVGAAQDMAAEGMTDGEIMRSGRWQSMQMLVRYTKELRVHEAGMKRLSEKQEQTRGLDRLKTR
jgi:integrase